LNSYKGASYGIKFSSENLEKINPETEIENLYLTGQDVVGCGFNGALNGSVITYISITGDDIFSKKSFK
jgi:all-trans-retinol 13,14-reductase